MSFAWPRRSCICVAASCVPSQGATDNGHHARGPARADDHYAPGRSGVFIVRPQMMTAENPHSNTAVITDRDAERWVQHPHNPAHRQRTSLALGAGDQMHAPRGHGPEFEGPFVQFHPWTSSGHRSVSAAVDAPWQATQPSEPPSTAVRPVFLSNLELGRVDIADRFDLRSRLQGYVTVTEALSSDGPAFYSTSCTMPSSAPGADIVTTTATGVARHSKSGAPKRTQPRFARHAKPAKANRSVTTNSWAPVRHPVPWQRASSANLANCRAVPSAYTTRATDAEHTVQCAACGPRPTSGRLAYPRAIRSIAGSALQTHSTRQRIGRTWTIQSQTDGRTRTDRGPDRSEIEVVLSANDDDREFGAGDVTIDLYPEQDSRTPLNSYNYLTVDITA